VELITVAIPKSTKVLTIAPLGDFQWSGDEGPTAKDQLSRHIDYCLERDAYFCGLGDYIDFLSPSNRQRLINAGLYDTAQEVIAKKALELLDEVFEKFLKPTVGRWLFVTEGHHFYEAGGQTTDQILADKLKTKFVGTSVFCRIKVADLTIYAHHGTGGGILPGSALNKPYHVAGGLQGADLYLFGHDTKIATTRLSRPYPRWDVNPPRLEHRDIWLIRCGGFSKSNILGHRIGSIPRGDYAEQAQFTPSPLSAPIITVDLKAKSNRIRVSI
jgi:hypothetical protein